MSSKYNPYQVICIGEDCKGYDVCGKECILKQKYKKWIQGCNYSNIGDCENCSHKKHCYLVKPYSEEINKIEVKRTKLENENRKLKNYISKWDEIEKDVKSGKVKSVTDVVYFDRSRQQMVNRISDNKKLIKAYLKKEEKLLH